jgi:uncharacterized protein YebE (UPF0316 family)
MSELTAREREQALEVLLLREVIRERRRCLDAADRVREKGNGVAHDDAVWREACRQVMQAIQDV